MPGLGRLSANHIGVTRTALTDKGDRKVLPEGALRLKRLYSLKKNRDFQFTYRVGKSVGCRLFTLIYVRDRRKPRKPKSSVLQAEAHVRVGFSVSKKVGNSVQRNRVKRRLREALSPYLQEICPGHNLIFIARPGMLDEPFLSVRQTVLQMLKKAELYKPAKVLRAEAEAASKGADVL